MNSNDDNESKKKKQTSMMMRRKTKVKRRQRTRENTERNRETSKKGVDEEVAVEESEDDRDNASLDPGESCANVRLQEIENILQIRELLCISFKRVMGEIKAMKTFYTSEFNHQKHSGKMTLMTWLKLVKHLVAIETFGVNKFEVRPSLAMV